MAPHAAAHSTVKYEPLELSPTSRHGPASPPAGDGGTSSSSMRRGRSTTASNHGTAAAAFTTHKKPMGIAVFVAMAVYALLTLLGGSSRDERTHFLQSQISYPSLAVDLYKRPGTLQLDRNDYRPAWRHARWIPLDEIGALTSTGRNGLERDFHLDDGFDLLEAIHATLKSAVTPDEHEKVPGHVAPSHLSETDPSFDYVRNKTILLLGDGVDRNTLDYACQLLQGDLTIRKYTELPPDLHAMSDKIQRDPHVCELPGFLKGTSIWSIMTYSVLATEDTFSGPLDEVRPRSYLPRLQQIVQVLSDANVQPDMVVMHSTLWDLDAINFDDASINMPPSEMLTIARLGVYRQKLGEAILKVREAFPDAKLLYRTLQVTKVDRGDWWMSFMPPGTQPFPRVPYAMNKGAQLNTVTSQVLAELGIPKLDLHSVLSGYIEDYEGSVHIGNIGKTIYTQMLLYYLRISDAWY